MLPPQRRINVVSHNPSPFSLRVHEKFSAEREVVGAKSTWATAM